MAIPFDHLPPHVKALIQPQDLDHSLSPRGSQFLQDPSSPPIHVPTHKSELHHHSAFLAWIKKLNTSLAPGPPLFAIHARPDQPSGISPGWPDFSLFHSASTPPLFIEFKASQKSKIPPHQQSIHNLLRSLGHSLLISTHHHHAISATINHFNLPISL